MNQNFEIIFRQDEERKMHLTIDGVNFYELEKDLVRREPLARTTTSINMNGQIK